MSYNFIDKFQVVPSETADVTISNNCDGQTASLDICELDICSAKNEDCSCAAIAWKRRETQQENDVKLSIGPLSVSLYC